MDLPPSLQSSLSRLHSLNPVLSQQIKLYAQAAHQAHQHSLHSPSPLTPLQSIHSLVLQIKIQLQRKRSLEKDQDQIRMCQDNNQILNQKQQSIANQVSRLKKYLFRQEQESGESQMDRLEESLEQGQDYDSDIRWQEFYTFTKANMHRQAKTGNNAENNSLKSNQAVLNRKFTQLIKDNLKKNQEDFQRIREKEQRLADLEKVMRQQIENPKLESLIENHLKHKVKQFYLKQLESQLGIIESMKNTVEEESIGQKEGGQQKFTQQFQINKEMQKYGIQIKMLNQKVIKDSIMVRLEKIKQAEWGVARVAESKRPQPEQQLYERLLDSHQHFTLNLNNALSQQYIQKLDKPQPPQDLNTFSPETMVLVQERVSKCNSEQLKIHAELEKCQVDSMGIEQEMESNRRADKK